jgi:UDP-GlcNAc:undecaprenyl-phosphate GlcNAc-1-phosphate transferase
MSTDLLVFGAAFASGLALVRVFRDLAVKHGIYDPVEGGRKLHTRPIPRVGGLAVIIAAALPIVALAAVRGAVGDVAVGQDPLLAALVGGGSLILALGVWDDLLGARAWFKFGIQIVAALLACAAGVSIDGISVPFYGFLDLGPAAVPITVFWIVLVTNAINLIDGMDGLAGSVVAMAGLTLLVMNWINGDAGAALVLAAVVGAVIAFLVYNVNPATIFLGDAGSLTLGFIMAVVSVHASQKAYTLFSVVGAVLILGVPIFDLSMAVLRRALMGKPLFAADQHHVHHLLLRRGLSQRQSVMLLAGAAALVQGLALVLIYASDAVSAFVILLLVPLVAIVVRSLGYVEIIRNGRRERLLQEVLAAASERENLLLALRRDLDDLHDVDVLWTRLAEVAAGIGLERLELEVEPQLLGFTVPRRRCWQRSMSPEERGIHIQNLERVDYPLVVARRKLGTLKMSWYAELQLFAPHDRALHELMAHLAMEALVLVMLEDSRMDNVIPFRRLDRDQPNVS